MNTTAPSNSEFDLRRDVIPIKYVPKSNKKLYITLGIIGGVILVTTIVILAVFIPKGKKKPKISKQTLSGKTLPQSIELFIDINESSKKIRNLQGNEEKVQIIGDNFNEFNSDDTIIYIDGKNMSFDKSISVKLNTVIMVEIKFSKKIKTFKEMFKGCNKIKNVTLKDVETDDISDTSSMFEECTSLNDIKFDNTSISNITNTAKMFKGCSNLNKIEIEKFSTDNVKDMSQMFDGCSSFDNNNFIEELSTKNVESMNEIFSGCSKITSLDLSKYDTSNTKNMSGMFKGMKNLVDIKLNSFNTEKVEHMNEMFEGCSSIQSLDLSKFNTKIVIDMNKMFYSCSKLENLDISSFVLTRCNNTENMFGNTPELLLLSIQNKEIINRPGLPLRKTIEILIEPDKPSIERRNLNENKEQILGEDFKDLNTSNAIIYINGTKTKFDKYIPIKSSTPVKVEISFLRNLTTLKDMFKGCNKIKSVVLKDMDIDDISDTSSMFEECTSLNDIKFDNTTISNITNTSKMFKGCSNLNKIEIEKFSTDNVKDMSQMFDGCSSFDNNNFIEELSTKNVESMNEIFSGCSKITSLDLSKYDTSNTKNMSGMFKGMTNLENLKVNSFNTEKVEYMNEMFEGCSSIKKLDLSKFNTSKVKNMDKMFSSCSKLFDLDVSSFKLSNCNSINNMILNTKEILKLSIENDEIKNRLGIPLKTQNIELLIEGDTGSTGKRNLQEVEEKVKIFGDDFTGLDSDNAMIFMDGEKISFEKYLSIKSTKTVKIVIKFMQKIETFKEMFSGCKRIREVTLKDVETELVLETTSMFESCTSLSEVKFENMNIQNITSTAKMFQKCTSLHKIEIEDFSTDKTKDMSKMFDGCSSLNESTFIEKLSTKNAESMDEMFSGCSNITSLDLSGFDTSNAVNMSGMFKGMTGLEKLEISSFHTEKVEYMSEMFENCSSIINLNLSNFNTEMVINMDRMFSSCLKLESVDLTSFNLSSCNSTESMFSNTTRQIMLSIEQNEELMIKAGYSWNEQVSNDTNITKIPLDISFIVDATGSMSGAIESVKEKIIYIAVHLMNKTGMNNYDLSLSAVFYRDPIDNRYYDIHEIFDFDKNALLFRIFVGNISAKGGADGPEDWAGAFNLAKNLSWRNDSVKFIIHIADAPAHGLDWVNGNDKYPAEGAKTDEIIAYFAKNNFAIAGFKVDTYNINYPSKSFLRAQKIFRNNGNFDYLIKPFSTYEIDEDYFLNLVYESFQSILNLEMLQGIEISAEQGDIDWKKVKENKSINFAILRAGIGNETDKKFEDNYKAAKNSGIPLGVYWVAKSTDISEAEVECEKFKNILEGKQIEFPIYYVIEEEAFYLEWDSILSVFQNTFISTKYLRGLRAKQSKIQKYFDNDEFEGYEVWMSDICKSYPELNVDTYVWNYNNEGKIDGIKGNVSLVKSILNYTKITFDNNYNGF